MEDVQGWIVALALALVFIVLPAGLAVFGLATPLLRARRMRIAQGVSLTSDRCVACGATDLEPIVPSVTRCRACGFEGGDGMVDLNRERRRAALEKIDLGQRRALALEKLREAELLLGTAEESLDRAAKASVIDMSGSMSPPTPVPVATRHPVRASNLRLRRRGMSTKRRPNASEQLSRRAPMSTRVRPSR